MRSSSSCIDRKTDRLNSARDDELIGGFIAKVEKFVNLNLSWEVYTVDV